MVSLGSRSAMGWQFWIDRGGTFTDLIGCAPDGSLHVQKVLSEGLVDDPAVAAMRRVLGCSASDPLPIGVVDGVRLGTTVATNALLEGNGVPLLLITNVGFADALRIGDQHRSDLFALHQPTSTWLATEVLECPGRINAQGKELEPLRIDAALRRRFQGVLEAGIQHCVVAFLHAHRNTGHEREVAALLKTLGFTSVVCSHEVSVQARLIPRGQTALVEAAVAPVLNAYLQQVQGALGRSTPLRVMTSSGALLPASGLLAKDTILSGPAAGMVGAVAAARSAGFRDVPVLGFDMGGTSTDVFCVSSADDAALQQLQEQTEIAGLKLLSTRLPIETVAAGGGSVLHCQDDRLLVGPRSAGARPGPACYRAGGPLTITDANLLLGRLQVDRFPPVFGAQGNQPPDLDVVRDRFNQLANQLQRPAEQLAEAALQLAIERMADAIRRISLHRGQDVRGGVLVAYGGAGGQHACRLAEELGLASVLLHPMAGVLSAYGMGQARQRRRRQRHLGQPLTPQLLQSLPHTVEHLQRGIHQEFLEQGDLAENGTSPGRCWVSLELRYPTSDQCLTIPWTSDCDLDGLLDSFRRCHQTRFGYCIEADQSLIVEMLSVDQAAPQQYTPAEIQCEAPPVQAPGADAEISLYLRGRGWQAVPVFERHVLPISACLEGPALIAEATGCTVLEPGWTLRVDAGASLVLTRDPVEHSASLAHGQAERRDPDRAHPELFRHRFMAIAEQMGERLRLSSRSVNIRERLDFSCALFNERGELVANAPHIPVHLGSMGESVKDLLGQIGGSPFGPLEPGDTVLTNDPFHGGTHLPDITAITPVFCGGPTPSFYVASRGHHVDVGGITPGSMPSFSSNIEDEGLLLRNVLFVRGNALLKADWEALCSALPNPPRNPKELLADLQAQVAANQAGVDGLLRLVGRVGEQEVRQQMDALQQQASASVIRLLERVSDAQFNADLDDGSHLSVSLRADRKRQKLCVDFTGTSHQRSDNFNAPLAVTKAAVLYVIRSLLDVDIPLNEGCFAPIELKVPLGSMLNPLPPAAVVAGNVEVSQVLCNLLFGAFGVQAASQGTMNNLSFGNRRCQYYETVAGGGGAGKGFCGSKGLQSHMTNSRLTDPEVLEDRYPVQLEEFAYRSGSGGAGLWSGGDGLVRTLRFLEPMDVSLICGSRRVAPFGLQGGDSGASGRTELLPKKGDVQVLPGCVHLQLQAGDAIRLLTPGGGGYGSHQH